MLNKEEDKINKVDNSKLSKSKKFSLKFNLFDIIVGSISVVLAVSLIIINTFIFTKNENMDDKVVFIYYDSDKLEEHAVYFKDLGENEEHEIYLEKEKYPLLLADMTILVSKKNGIKIDKEESPQNICSRQGWVNRTNVHLTCLPNYISVVIEDINEVDFDINLE